MLRRSELSARCDGVHGGRMAGQQVKSEPIRPRAAVWRPCGLPALGRSLPRLLLMVWRGTARAFHSHPPMVVRPGSTLLSGSEVRFLASVRGSGVDYPLASGPAARRPLLLPRGVGLARRGPRPASPSTPVPTPTPPPPPLPPETRRRRRRPHSRRRRRAAAATTVLTAATFPADDDDVLGLVCSELFDSAVIVIHSSVSCLLDGQRLYIRSK